MPPRAVLLAVAGALILAVGGGAAMLVARGNEASRLRAEADGLRVALDAASRGAEAEARARRRAAAEAGPDAALAAELGAGGGFVYRAEIAFPPESGELDEVLRAELDARLAEVRTAVSGIPHGQEWLLLVDGHNARAATEAGVLVDEWGLALLRVGSVADFLVRSGVPADRLAVRFQAGFATRGPAAAGGTGAAATAARTVELKVLCCQP